MKKNYTTIPVETQTATTLAKNEKGSLLSHMAGENGLIPSILEAAAVDEILSTSIYNKPEVAIRETLNNALRQCRTAEKIGAKPQINIIFDVKNNNLIFEEIDSMGMPVKIFEDVYRHTGRSGNFEGEESGQFGIGKKSFRAIADSMIFETFARDTNEKYAFMVKGADFEELTTPNLEKFGSRVSFAIKKGVNLADLVKYVTSISKFTQVKTYLHISHDLKENPDHTSIAFEKGITQIGPIDKKEFLAKKLDTEKKDLEFVELDKDDYYLLMAFSSRYNSDYNRDKEVRYNNLVGIPISLGEHTHESLDRVEQNEIPDPGFTGYILNIKNERKYPPVASRDNLKEDSFKRLSELIQNDIDEYFSQIDVSTITEYKESSFKYFIKNLPYSDGIPETTRGFNKLLGRQNNSYNHENDIKFFLFDSTPKKEDDRQYSRELIDLEILEKHGITILCNYNKTMKRINRVLEHSSNVVILVPDGNKNQRHASLMLAEFAGIKSVSDYMKENNIKAPRNEIKGEVSVRMCSYSNSSAHMDIDELDKFCIRVPKEELEGIGISEYVRNVTSHEYNYYGFLRDQKKLENSDSITLQEFLSHNKKQEFVTSQGTLTGKQIMSKPLIAVITPSKSKYSDMLTFEFVKTKLKNYLIILNDGEEEDKTNKVNAFLLAYKVNNPEYDFNTIGDQYDSSIASNIVKPLNLEINGETLQGTWKDTPKAALFYLGEIKDQNIRELYAKAYSKIYEYGDDGWESDNKEDIAKHNALHKIFEEMEKQLATHTVLELSQQFLESKSELSDKLDDFFEELLKSEIKKIANQEQRVITAAQICLKDKIKDGSLSVKIEEESNYSPDITLNFEIVGGKQKLSKELFELVCGSVEGYQSLESVSFDGEKIEVVLG